MLKLLTTILLLVVALNGSAQLKIDNTNGKTILRAHNAPLLEILEVLSRHFKKELVLKTPKDRLLIAFDGALELKHLDKIMEIIKYNTGIKYSIQEKALVVGYPVIIAAL